MNEGMLEDYLDRDVRVHFAPHDDFRWYILLEEGGSTITAKTAFFWR